MLHEIIRVDIFQGITDRMNALGELLDEQKVINLQLKSENEVNG